MNLRIAIVEDTAGDAEHLSSLIFGYEPDARIFRFESAETFLNSALLNRFDLVFMDIYLLGQNGIEAASKFRERGGDSTLVFTTTSPEHALEAFRVNAAQYLIKPVQASDIKMLLQKRRIELESERRNFMQISVKGTKIDIPLDKVFYIEVRNHNCFIHFADNVIETGTTMRLEDFHLLISNPNFYRCHRSFIVNFDHVASIDLDFTMENGDTVYIRQSGLKQCADAFKSYLLSKLSKEV
ncbi:MAG: LytTR family DNA-binding domain-containing protein [Clostridia bacterium]|nr:LytTR family DNA-binding domain-containing protein [Clostridia bacterium]